MTKHNKTILIVEDETAMLDAVAKKCVNEGFKVIKAKDGEEGFNAAVKEHPDLILLDIIMPKLDGMTLAKRVREGSDWGKYVPIILLTNLNDPESVSEAAKFGVYDFLVKTDWRLDDIIKLIKGKLGL